jgi:hypothetical protein
MPDDFIRRFSRAWDSGEAKEGRDFWQAMQSIKQSIWKGQLISMAGQEEVETGFRPSTADAEYRSSATDWLPFLLATTGRAV